MDQILNALALLGGSAALAIGTIPAVFRNITALMRANNMRKLEIAIDGEKFVIDSDHVDSEQLAKIEQAISRTRALVDCETA